MRLIRACRMSHTALHLQAIRLLVVLAMTDANPHGMPPDRPRGNVAVRIDGHALRIIFFSLLPLANWVPNSRSTCNRIDFASVHATPTCDQFQPSDHFTIYNLRKVALMIAPALFPIRMPAVEKKKRFGLKKEFCRYSPHEVQTPVQHMNRVYSCKYLRFFR